MGLRGKRLETRFAGSQPVKVAGSRPQGACGPGLQGAWGPGPQGLGPGPPGLFPTKTTSQITIFRKPFGSRFGGVEGNEAGIPPLRPPFRPPPPCTFWGCKGERQLPNTQLKFLNRGNPKPEAQQKVEGFGGRVNSEPDPTPPT